MERLYLTIRKYLLVSVYRHIDLYNCKQLILACAILLACTPTYCQEFEIKNGVNIQASYYNRGRVSMGWELMKAYPEIEAVRIEIEPNRASQARTWIKEAHDHGYQVIATYHDSGELGTDSRQELNKAAEWWKNNYVSLSSSGPIIINVMNEWGSHDISPKDYANAYNEAIETIRSVYSGHLIVDVPGYGQATKIAADAYPLIEDKKIIYSVHIYTSAVNVEEQRWLSSKDLSDLDATGAPCMIGEFSDDSLGGADWCGLIDLCYQAGWPLFGWAWNGDGRGMNMIEPHWDDEPLASTYTATELMEVITDKLAGIPCYSQADEDCELNLIGEICNDDNEYTVNDRYNENCHCAGVFAEDLNSNTPEVDLIIYPNPVGATQEITIEFFKIYSSGQINIINSMGQTLLSQTVTQDKDRVTVNTSQLRSGIYWASFYTNQKVFASKAFIII